MDPALIRVVTLVAGLWLLALILRSMVRVALMNQHYRDGVAQLTWFVVYRCLAVCMPTNSDYPVRQKVLFWFFPTYILSLIVVYFVVTMTGFACLYRALQAVSSWHEAFIASGSALNTLGFATPPNAAGQWLAIPEGAIGLGIVVFLFTFVPGYQAVVMLREDRTAWAYARAGDPPTGAGLLEWRERAGDTTGAWETSESWFRTLADTHSVSPMLALAPSVRIGQCWVVAAAAILDAASMAASTLEAPKTDAAALCLATGTESLLVIAAALGWDSAGQRTAGSTITRAAHDAACARLTAAGIALKADTEASWRDYVTLRSQYEEVLIFVAGQVFAPRYAT